ncbi:MULTISPECIES: NfeD family protein [Listeria]|uniref:NfeD family protein n=1 Tax=Listeria TaxID=1637 RepID=UPI000B58EFD3|nr:MULTISPECIES: NfeD family protein [Listeria]
MMVFGMPIENVYYYILIVVGILIVIDLISALIFSVSIVSFALDLLPIPGSIILYFLGAFSLAGFLGEKYTSLSSINVLIGSIIIGLIFSSILYFGILLPLSRTSDSIAYETKDLEGKTGVVITSIPSDGFGEVLIEMNAGKVAKAAKSSDNEPISLGETVLIIDAEDAYILVSPYTSFLG